MGFFARLTSPDGAFWYIVPIATTGIPLARALRNVSAPPMTPTCAEPPAITVTGCTFGPYGSRVSVRASALR